MILAGIELPNPDWNDSINRIVELHVHKTMSGQIYTYVRTNSLYLITVEISNIIGPVKEDLQTYFDTYDGSNVTLVDWHGENWSVKILTNPIVFTSHYRGIADEENEIDKYNNEYYKLGLQFEGTKI